MTLLPTSGPGRIVAVDNGDPTRLESFQSGEIDAFNGKCLVIIQTQAKPGEIKLMAVSPGLKTAEAVIRVMAD